MRKLVSALAVTTGLTLLSGPAHAQDGRNYPPGSGRLAVSESTVSPGESFTVSGGGAKPGATVTFTLQRSSSALGTGQAVAAGATLSLQVAKLRSQALHSVALGSTTDVGGRFRARLTVPAGTQPGVYALTASSGGGALAQMTLRVVRVGGIGGLPFSGADVVPGLVAGATLIVAGGLLLLSLKRRRPAA
jgi:hypothetical protein